MTSLAAFSGKDATPLEMLANCWLREPCIVIVEMNKHEGSIPFTRSIQHQRLAFEGSKSAVSLVLIFLQSVFAPVSRHAPMLRSRKHLRSKNELN
jgi:hypothetical protein